MPDSRKHKKRILTRPLSDRFSDALVYAHTLHRHQPRKGKDIPYIGHLLGVASLVVEAGGNEDMAIAALLHDAVEDQGGQPRLDEIRRLFGPRVAQIVWGCTDSDEVDPGRKAPWCDRKQKYLDHVEHEADPQVRLVSAADKVHNARAVLLDHHEIGDAVFERFSKGKQGTLWYYRALVDAFRAADARDARGPHDACFSRRGVLGNPDDPYAKGRQRLVDELNRIVTELEARAGGKGVNPCRE